MTSKVHASLHIVILLKCQFNHLTWNADEQESVTQSEGTWQSPNIPVKLDFVSFTKEIKSIVSSMFMVDVTLGIS